MLKRAIVHLRGEDGHRIFNICSFCMIHIQARDTTQATTSGKTIADECGAIYNVSFGDSFSKYLIVL
jgi:hypothetical protein